MTADDTHRSDAVPTAGTPRLAALREEMAARNRRLADEADGEKRRDAVLTALSCLLWMGLGVACLLWSFHTTDQGRSVPTVHPRGRLFRKKPIAATAQSNPPPTSTEPQTRPGRTRTLRA